MVIKKKKKRVVKTLKGARKKVVKKISKKSKINKINSKKYDTKKIILKVHKRFASYEDKIDRLKELERELKILKPRGFNAEVKIIRSKLKDPTAIKEIEKRIVKLKKAMIARPKNKIKVKNLKKRFSNLKSKELPKINKQLKNLKQTIEDDKKRRKVDPGVSVLVEDRFNDFLGSLKKDLSSEEKRDERIFKNKLKGEFMDKENDLELNYKKKIQALKDLYEKKVQLHLEREVKEKLDKKVNSKVNERIVLKRAKLVKDFTIKSKKELQRNLIRQKRLLNMQLHKELNIRFEKKVSEVQRRVLMEKESYKKKIHIEDLKEMKIELSKQSNSLSVRLNKKNNIKLKSFISNEKLKLQKEFNIKVNKLNKEKIKFQKNFESKIVGLSKERVKLQKGFAMKVNNLSRDRTKLSLREVKIRNDAFADAKKELVTKLANQKKLIVSKLQGEFGLKLKSRVYDEKSKLQVVYDSKQRILDKKIKELSSKFNVKKQKVLDESKKQQEIMENHSNTLEKQLIDLRNKEKFMDAQIELLKSQVDKERELLKKSLI